MNQHHELILNTLKEAFQLQRHGYSQCLAAVSNRNEDATDHRYQLRILLLTSSSPYLDGTDLVVTMNNDEAILNPVVFLGTPLLQGSPVMDAFNWIRSYGPLIHWQFFSPFSD